MTPSMPCKNEIYHAVRPCSDCWNMLLLTNLSRNYSCFQVNCEEPIVMDDQVWL